MFQLGAVGSMWLGRPSFYKADAASTLCDNFLGTEIDPTASEGLVHNGSRDDSSEAGDKASVSPGTSAAVSMSPWGSQGEHTRSLGSSAYEFLADVDTDNPIVLDDKPDDARDATAPDHEDLTLETPSPAIPLSSTVTPPPPLDSPSSCTRLSGVCGASVYRSTASHHTPSFRRGSHPSPPCTA
jgi:hypothetical protein